MNSMAFTWPVAVLVLDQVRVADGQIWVHQGLLWQSMMSTVPD